MAVLFVCVAVAAFPTIAYLIERRTVSASKVSMFTRDDAAYRLSQASGLFSPQQLLVNRDDCRTAFAEASRGHEECGCEYVRRLTLALNLLTDDNALGLS